MITYAVNIMRRYDGLYVATFPDLPDIAAFGRDHEEAMYEAGVVLECTLKRLGSQGDTLPLPRARGALGISTNLFREPAVA